MKKNKSQDIDLLFIEQNGHKKKEGNKKRPSKNKSKKDKQQDQDKDLFKFDEEVVIGITKTKETKKTKTKKNKKKNKKKVENKKSNKIENKKNKKALAVVKWFTLIILLIGAILYFLMCPLFNIKEITVIGNKKISTNEILSLSEININENIFRIHLGQVEEKIKQNAYIDTVKINRKLPNKIQIQIEERTTTYMLEFVNAFAYINNQGYILEISEQKLNLPIIIGYKTETENIKPGNRLCLEDLQKLETVLKIVETAKSYEIANTISKIDITDSNNYTLLLETEKKTVYLGDASNINTRILYLKEILEIEKGKEMLVFLNVDINNEKVYTREKV